MRSKLYESLDEAVADIPDGASILLPGFSMVGAPHNLIAALHRQGAKHLTLIANSAGARDDIVTMTNLIDDRRVRKVVFAFTAGTHPSRPVTLQKLQASGEIEAELVPQGTLAERIRAGGAGIPAFYTPTSVGTALAEGKEHRVFDGRTYVMEEAITADYAFIRARKADEFGNLQFHQSARNFNPIMAMAATLHHRRGGADRARGRARPGLRAHARRLCAPHRPDPAGRCLAPEPRLGGTA